MIKKTIKCVAVLLVIVTLNSASAESIEQFNHDFYTQICTSLIACADDVGIAETFQLTKITNVESCVLVLGKRDKPENWQQTLAKKMVVFDPKASQICLTSITELSCKELGKRRAKPAGIKGCENVIVGTIDDNAQCSSHLACKSSNASCYGTCMTPRLLSCGDDLCTSTEYCDTEKNACFALKKNGETCLNFSECEDGCYNGTCKAPPPVVKPGGQCGNDYGHICSIGEFCAEDQCTPFRKKGQSCSADYNQFKECEAPLDCQDDKCV